MYSSSFFLSLYASVFSACLLSSIMNSLTILPVCTRDFTCFYYKLVSPPLAMGLLNIFFKLKPTTSSGQKLTFTLLYQVYFTLLLFTSLSLPFSKNCGSNLKQKNWPVTMFKCLSQEFQKASKRSHFCQINQFYSSEFIYNMGR